MEDPSEMPSHEILLHRADWARLTLEQLAKDAELSGLVWPAVAVPTDYAGWTALILEWLQAMDRQNPEWLGRFLYRVDLPESRFRENPFPSEEMAEAVLRREFMKVWFKARYRP